MATDPVETRQGDTERVAHWKVAECIGGWNVHGFDADGNLDFECLHLHPHRSSGVACGKGLFPGATGPRQ